MQSLLPRRRRLPYRQTQSRAPSEGLSNAPIAIPTAHPLPRATFRYWESADRDFRSSPYSGTGLLKLFYRIESIFQMVYRLSVHFIESHSKSRVYR